MKKLFLILCLLLTGCSAITRVAVPLPPPERHLPSKPDLPIYKLKRTDSNAAIAKAYIASIYIQQQWIDAVAE